MTQEAKPEGRPKSVDITNPEIRTQVELFGKLCATQKEMANWFDCTLRTIENYMSEKEDEEVTEFFRVYKKAQAESTTSLRRVQMAKAIDQEDTTLLIWLGKQLLGQKDKREEDSNINSTTTIISATPLTPKEWEEEHGK